MIHVIKPVNKDHLRIKTTFSWSIRVSAGSIVYKEYQQYPDLEPVFHGVFDRYPKQEFRKNIILILYIKIYNCNVCKFGSQLF